MKISQAFIFAAGRGQRMKPITDSIPKPLIKIHEKPIIDYAIEKFSAIPSIKKIIINGFYLAAQIQNHIKNLANEKLEFSLEPSKIETGGGLVFALANKKFDENEPILLANGDVFWQESENSNSVQKLCEYFEKSECDMLLALKKRGDYFGYEGEGDFDFFGKINNEVKDIFWQDGSVKSHVFVGLQIINPKILKLAPQECFSLSYFIKNAKNLGLKMKGVELDAEFFHIGDVKALEALHGK